MPLLIRLVEHARAAVDFEIDGQACRALQGDTLLTAILTQTERLRVSEFEHRARAGFCLMGACQDCWIDTVEGERLRACSTFVAPGMRIRTMPIADADETGAGARYGAGVRAGADACVDDTSSAAPVLLDGGTS
ncbi:(2Fe-2S)-binding protein [Alcaligenaceae bacterium A4P071]|nr:(2Fe-2S)-binding protein [Alcaligenaceae bacterium A4P071]